MKKLAIAILIAAACIMSTTGAWAYTTTFSAILTDSPGTLQLDVGVWDPTDFGGGLNPFFGTGYFGYVYSITNINYDTYLTDFVIAKPASVSVTLVSTPAGWSWVSHPGEFGWDTLSGSELYPGQTASGFTVKSTSWPYFTGATGWSGFNSPAYGLTLGPGVPEPASAMLLGLGLIGFAGVIRRKFMA